MGQLRSLQEELKKILFIGSKVTQSRFWAEGLPPRLQVYRNTVHGNAFETLESDYKYTRKQFSEEAWDRLKEAYFTKCPPAYWELNGCILSFPKFLKSQKIAGAIVDLAEYELTDLTTFIHPAVVDDKKPGTNPTISTKLFHYQIFDWTLNGCPSDKLPVQKPEILVFYRDLKHECHIRRGEPLELLMLDHFRKPEADLFELEDIREKILPQNQIPLQRVYNELKSSNLII